MSFISVTVGVRTNRNIFLNLWKNQSQTISLLKNNHITTSNRRMSSERNCIFCQIVNKTAEANILHEVLRAGYDIRDHLCNTCLTG